MERKMLSLSDLSLKRQLYALCAIFFVPVATMAFLLSDQAYKSIAFSEKERDGVAYLKILMPVVLNAATGGNDNSAKILVESSSRFDSMMKTWQPSTEFRIALSTQNDAAKKVIAGTTLATAIGDGSNLILDPDLDSYYVMDIAVTRLPALLEQITRINSILENQMANQNSDEQRSLELLLGQAVTTRKSLESSMFAAVRNNASGEIAADTLKNYGSLITSLDNYTSTLEQIIGNDPQTTINIETVARLQQKNKPLLRLLGIVHQKYLSSLDSLLKKRILNQYTILVTSLLISALALSIAFYMALKVARRIGTSVNAISDRIEAMVNGDLASPIPCQDERNEIGHIARSLKIFRQHAEDNASLSTMLETERLESQTKLEQLAYYDDLTGLPNRKLLTQHIENHIRVDASQAPSALIYFDLDGFKEVNDTMTHLAGDEVLRQVASRLQERATDNDIVARLGGDEFAIFVPVAGDNALLENRCNKMIQALAMPFTIFNSEQFLSASAGVSLYTLATPRDSIEIVRRADVSMYRAKSMGKNRLVAFDTSFDDEARYQKAIEVSLRDAIMRGDIQLHFQPQFDVRTSRLVSAEGLARWTSARHGEVSPTVFIPIAEATGLIYDLGMQMLRKAILAAQRWPDLRISINLSVAQLRHQKFVDEVRNLVKETDAPISRIELEVTESIVMDDDPALAERLAALHDIGFILALDDFGTGYSSLGYLSRYQFDRLKIDRGFVRGAGESERGAALLQSIAQMGRALGMDVCAEGVETYDDLRCTTEAGCTLLQGFYFSPAVSSMDIDMMIASGVGNGEATPDSRSQVEIEHEQRLSA
jgi:diguanylate cyclase (GGDEF)-like protein